MEDQGRNLNLEGPFPKLYMPKECTPLEINCESSENVFIHLKIFSPDTKGNSFVYNGLCNVKIVDGKDINVRHSTLNSTSSKGNMPVILTEANQMTLSAYDDSQVWIDPSISPYVYNSCDTPRLDSYTIVEDADDHISIEQQNTYITQNVYNYHDAIQYSPISDDQDVVEKVHEPIHNSDDYNIYQEEESECGVFLSQLSDEIINEKEPRTRDQKKLVGLKTDNEALKQLMSTNIQSVSRQQKTILFLKNDSGSGQTIQTISINDPSVDCLATGKADINIADDPTLSISNPRSKKYQCNKCKQIFNRLLAFKQHVVGNHRFYEARDVSGSDRYICNKCGKLLKNKEKFEQHCLGHGDPDLECHKCHKVFASKFSLRNHIKIHTRMFMCSYCVKSYSTARALCSHTARAHNVFMCDLCNFSCNVLGNLRRHQKEHKQVLMDTVSKTSSESDYAEKLHIDCDILELEEVVKSQQDSVQLADSKQLVDLVQQPDSVQPVDLVQQPDSVQPVDLVQQSNSVQPVDLVQQSDSVQPVDLVQQPDSVQPVDLVQQPDSVQPVDLVQQPDSVQPVDLVQQPDSVQPVDLVQQPDSVQPVALAQQPDPVPPVDLVQQPDSVQPVHLGQQRDSVQPVDSVQQPDSVQLVDLVQQPDSVQPIDLVEQPASVQPVDLVQQPDSVQSVDLVIAKVMSTKLFQRNGKMNKRKKDYNKACELCMKRFKRMSDLKRHLIEHVIRSTLAKNPINEFGVLNIRCEICQDKVFSKIDRYKAHLREHAKVTLYKCTVCDKSFSDSSNFSKHKKIHGITFFQCDICQRKFNTKKMITLHMEHHNKNRPLRCLYCEKVFHFQSMLKKHINCSHADKRHVNIFRCKFCRDSFRSLKEKWDHEWTAHKLRTVVVDCLVCGSRFRKYAELKRHCTEEHDIIIPPAKKLLQWRLKNKKKIIEGQ